MAEELGCDRENYDFHSFDELGMVAIGDLLCYNGNKQPVNEFPEGQCLKKKTLNQFKHFSNDPKHRNDYDDTLAKHPECTSAKLEWSNDETRADLFHALARTMMRNYKPLGYYYIEHNREPFLCADDCKSLIQVEGY